ncbi:MAG: 50S ribosomal protein L17 [Parcubacteria group bacterium GW2011_GWC2_42_6]|nr:MAG: 50S ribosomal protein L17 [Parcubacteria group bacterium GW2011_GWC2_42_6]
MKHLKKGRKFGREKNQRRAFLKSLAANLILREKIKTTLARGKEIRSTTEKLITRAKKGQLADQRMINGLLPKAAAQKLFKELAPQLTRTSGYLRLTKIGRRTSDGAEMVTVEIIK